MRRFFHSWLAVAGMSLLTFGCAEAVETYGLAPPDTGSGNKADAKTDGILSDVKKDTFSPDVPADIDPPTPDSALDGKPTFDSSVDSPTDGAPSDVALDVSQQPDVVGSDSLADSAPDVSASDLGADGSDSTVGADTATDVSPLDSSFVDVGKDSALDTNPDLGTTETGGTVAFGSACQASSVCVAPSGQTASCDLTYGTPVCTSTCNNQAAFSLCEGGKGICVPEGSTKRCLPKCGDAESAVCGPGSSCNHLGYRKIGTTTNYATVGVCAPDCSASGADACQASGSTCDVTRRVCSATAPAAGTKTIFASCNPSLTTSNGCASNVCLGGASSTVGYCSAFCNSQNATSVCGSGVCWYDFRVDQPAGYDNTTVPVEHQYPTYTGNRGLGLCLKACETQTDCPSGFTCGQENGSRVCLPYSLAQTASPKDYSVADGTACKSDLDCAGFFSYCGHATGYNTGICQDTLSCPTNSSVGVNSECWKTCTGTAHSECAAGLVCNYDKRCEPSICHDSRDCDTGYACDAVTSTCKTSALTSDNTADVGKSCTTSTNCTTGTCLTGTFWPAGYCTSFCTLLPDLTDTCPSGSICDSQYVGVMGRCLDLCDAASGNAPSFGACRTVDGYSCKGFPFGSKYGWCAK